MAVKRSRLPRFRSDPEERAFWAKHSLEDFAHELEDLDVEVRPTRSEQIALRLSREDLRSLQALAKKRGVGHTTLARSVLEQWLARAREEGGAVQARTRHPS